MCPPAIIHRHHQQHLHSGPSSFRSTAQCLFALLHPLFLLLLLAVLPQKAQQQQQQQFSSVCQFPALQDWRSCQRDQSRAIGGDGAGGGGGFWPSREHQQQEEAAPLNGWFCDPEYSISMSEVSALDESVRALYAEHGSSDCVCASSDNDDNQSPEVPPSDPMGSVGDGGHCWHRFGFAFVHQLRPGPDVARADQCPSSSNGNGTATVNRSESEQNSFEAETKEEKEEEAEQQQQHFELPADWEIHPDRSFAAFAQNFARVLRERWALGRCGEDLLLLVVQRPPVQQIPAGPFSSASSRLYGPLPMLFVAPGPLVERRLAAASSNNNNAALIGAPSPLDLLVQEANAQLQREARPLFRVLGHFLLRLGHLLARASTSAGGGHEGGGGGHHAMRPPKLRSHVPLWAWAVFAACGVAFGLMALGLFLIRTSTRRPNACNGQPQGQPGHGAMVARRHWKEEEQPPPQTYVNLVQMLMPHPKPAQTNMPQQV